MKRNVSWWELFGLFAAIDQKLDGSIRLLLPALASTIVRVD